MNNKNYNKKDLIEWIILVIVYEFMGLLMSAIVSWNITIAILMSASTLFLAIAVYKITLAPEQPNQKRVKFFTEDMSLDTLIEIVFFTAAIILIIVSAALMFIFGGVK